MPTDVGLQDRPTRAVVGRVVLGSACGALLLVGAFLAGRGTDGSAGDPGTSREVEAASTTGPPTTLDMRSTSSTTTSTTTTTTSTTTSTSAPSTTTTTSTTVAPAPSTTAPPAAPPPTSPPATAPPTTTVPTQTLEGVLVASSTYGTNNAPYCWGQESYTPPTRVTIRDETSYALVADIAVDAFAFELLNAGDGTINTWCSYPFTARVPETARYSIQVDSETPVGVALEELQSNGWTVSIISFG